MANRINTFLIKRSNTSGKIPASGSLLLGELALNTADAKLYTSGTTAGSILPIGWDRVSKTGDTMTGTLFVTSISANTISANTYNGYVPANDSGVVHILSAETITGVKTFNSSVTASNGSGIGMLVNPSLVASAANNINIGLDIAPTFNNNSQSNISNYGLRSLLFPIKVQGVNIGSLSVPTISSAVSSSTGGTLTDGTYYYKVVAVDFQGYLTTPSAEVSSTIIGTTGSVLITWGLIKGATSYRVYRGTVSNVQTGYYTINGVNTVTYRDINSAITTSPLPTINNSSYGFYNSSVLRTNNITIVNGGFGDIASINFEKSTDTAAINVVETSSDNTMYEFKMTDNPDGTGDYFHWFMGDWQNPSTGWKPLKLTNITSQFVGQTSSFWSSFLLPSSTPYFTTNADLLANSSIKGDPYNSNTYSLLKDGTGGGTGTLNVEVSGFTGTENRIYWITVASPTTFNWGSGNYTTTAIGTNVTITGSFQLLNQGVQIKLSTTGQTANDRWAFRAFPAPKMGIGTSSPTAPFQVSSTAVAASAIARGSFINPTLLASANNDVLVGLDINPTFTNGVFTGITNYATRITGNVLINGNLTANTFSATNINKVDYIVFNTGTTSAATVDGTVYFNNTEKSLSYNTSINQGVTVNLGQQQYLRVFNNSGISIQRGKALEILSAYSGLPSVSLAVNKHTGFNIVGISAEIIPNNSEGIVITSGVISNIQLTGVTIGSLVYASDSVPGQLDSSTKYLSFPLTARTNSVGYVIQTGATTGKLFVDIQNENNLLSFTDLERDIIEGNIASTGVFSFSGISLSTTTTFNVSAAQGWIIDNLSNPLQPDAKYVGYSGQTGLTTPYLLTATSTYILLNSGGTLTLLNTFPTPQQRRENIYLGKLGHANKTTLINAFNEADSDISPISQLRDMFTPIKLINLGVTISPNGINLNFNNSLGSLWGMGIGFSTNKLNPNSISISGNTPVTFQYRTQTGGTSTNRTAVIPGNYDLNGVITAIGSPAKQATNQRIYLVQNGIFRMQYGQTVYDDLTLAVAAAQTENFNTFSNFKDNAILIGILSLRSDTTNLSDPSYAKFLTVSKFGEGLGGTGGLSTTTLQQAYNNSTQPEIVTNSTLGGLSIQNGAGSADNVTNLLEGLNTAGNVTSLIRADGYISGTSSLFSGNSSLELVKIIQNGSGDAFVVEDIANGDASHFVINASGNTGIGLLQPLGTDKLTVSGDTSIYGAFKAITISANTALFSASTQNILKIIGSGNSTTLPIFSVQGSQGELFSITDSLTGSLFSVNDISGLPILEVFSDDTVLMGSYLAPSLNTTTKVTVGTGLTNIHSISKSEYTGAFFDYTINNNNTNLRAGNIMAIWNTGTTIQYSETSTNDIGNTNGLTFNVIISGSSAILRTSGVTGSWTVKTIVRSI